MWSPREIELIAEARVEQWRNQDLPDALRQAQIERELRGRGETANRPGRHTALGRLGDRVAGLGDRERSSRPSPSRPGASSRPTNATAKGASR